ncbi:hypothetical protein BHE74_00048549 [Ensete ventricosum]|nr:hypothetical protein BHE74_00048549 [Ensete ventricosum]RZR91964.1 hypothetical protein BHM03_00020156 [Ensete ventricosum]
MGLVLQRWPPRLKIETKDSAITIESKPWHDFLIPKAFKTFRSIGVITCKDKLDDSTSGLLGLPPLALTDGTEEDELDEDEIEGKEEEEVILT